MRAPSAAGAIDYDGAASAAEASPRLEARSSAPALVIGVDEADDRIRESAASVALRAAEAYGHAGVVPAAAGRGEA